MFVLTVHIVPCNVRRIRAADGSIGFVSLAETPATGDALTLKDSLGDTAATTDVHWNDPNAPILDIPVHK